VGSVLRMLSLILTNIDEHNAAMERTSIRTMINVLKGQLLFGGRSKLYQMIDAHEISQTVDVSAVPRLGPS
jgi:hypothetical protein